MFEGIGITRSKIFVALAGFSVLTLVFLFYFSGIQSPLCFTTTVSGSHISTPRQHRLQYQVQSYVEELQENDAIHVRGTRRRLPQALIIGVRKAGTRALLAMLNIHPHITIAANEIHFFDEDENYTHGLDWYRRQMPHSYPNQLTIEKSPAYFITDEVPERIYAMNSTVKLLLIVREPTERVVSDYTQVHLSKIRRNKTHEQFERLAINDYGEINTKYKAVRISMYYRHMLKWLEYFSLEQIHIVDGDTLIANPLPELKKVETFLQLEPRITETNVFFNKTRGFYCLRNFAGTTKCLAESKGRPHPVVQQDAIDKLHAFYRPYNEQFYKLIGRRFNWP